MISNMVTTFLITSNEVKKSRIRYKDMPLHFTQFNAENPFGLVFKFLILFYNKLLIIFFKIFVKFLEPLCDLKIQCIYEAHTILLCVVDSVIIPKHLE
ncbi:hypothetical protein BpHYR1_016606 [Brachionus plicatilis]|uniref:Uncharacterized protein n=1 Tax=Brachionus plicatilis TaxID=10195 RepID=A0A3M7SKH2_BRAPC|nr:hypothetical protein BpHYR1_016606 [Brachionus plicatilis]